jgi:hypothetical protein
MGTKLWNPGAESREGGDKPTKTMSHSAGRRQTCILPIVSMKTASSTLSRSGNLAFSCRNPCDTACQHSNDSDGAAADLLDEEGHDHRKSSGRANGDACRARFQLTCIRASARVFFLVAFQDIHKQRSTLKSHALFNIH